MQLRQIENGVSVRESERVKNEDLKTIYLSKIFYINKPKIQVLKKEISEIIRFFLNSKLSYCSV